MQKTKLEDLSVEDLKIGVKKAIDNAADLFSEGDILLENKRHARAGTLYQLSIEELGKSRLLFSIIIDRKLDKKIDFKKLNNDFTFHQSKSQNSIAYELIPLLFVAIEKEGSAEERKKAFLEHLDILRQEHELAAKLNEYKNSSLYVGLLDNKFVSPNEVIPKELIAKLRTNALIRIRASQSLTKYLLNDIDKLVDDVKGMELLKKDSFDIEEDVLNKFFK